MLALRSAPPEFESGAAERIASDVYGITVDAARLSGERDCNFHARAADGREFVLRILDAGGDSQSADCQIRVLAHLAEQDPSLPVPRVFATVQGLPLGRIERGGRVFHTCLLGYLRGRLLADMPSSVRLYRDVGATVGRIDRALQGFFHPALAQRIAWDVRRLPELQEFVAYVDPPDVRRGIEEAIQELINRLPILRGLRSQAIHGDCHAANLLVAPAEHRIRGVLDFGDMIHAPRILEAAVTLAELSVDCSTDLQALQAVLEGFSSIDGFEAAEIAQLHDLIIARHAVTLLVHAWRVRHDPAGATLLDQSAARAVRALEWLRTAGRERMSECWHSAAGTADAQGLISMAPIDVKRRQRLMGAGAELFYDRPLHLVRGSGVWLYDPQGQAYLDVYNNVPHVGHAHPGVVRAIQEQAATLATHTRYLHGAIVNYAEELTARCPPHLDACLFVNSGSEANDVAWRLAQFATGRRGAVVMAHAYHGITSAVAALTPGSGQPEEPHVVTLALPTALTMDDAIDLAVVREDAQRALATLQSRGFAPAAFFIDSALTSSGILDPPREWLDVAAASLRAAGALLVADEVQCGLGRSGSHFWGFERRGLVPDIVTLGKPIGNGYPMGAVIAGRELIEAFQSKFGFFSTFGGNPVAAVAGLAVLRVLDGEQLLANAKATGNYLSAGLNVLAKRHACLGRVRGSGLLLGLEVLSETGSGDRLRTHAIVNELAQLHRVLIGSEGPGADILKLRPPMVFYPEHADRLLGAIDSAAAALDFRA